MWKLLLVAYLVMAFFVGESRSRCGDGYDSSGVRRQSVVDSVFYGAIWPVSMVIYWGQHGGLGDFFTRAERAACE